MSVLPPSIAARNFVEPLSQTVLNIEDKSRSNLFTWRGQFSPQLIESLLRAYCLDGANVLDPFSGSGTTLYEAGCLGMSAYGFELNPAAWILSRVYQFINMTKEERCATLDLVRQGLNRAFPASDLLYAQSKTEIPISDLATFLQVYRPNVEPEELVFVEALVILLDLYDKDLNSKLLYDYFYKLSDLVLRLPHSQAPIIAQLADARSLPLDDGSIDFVLTSPPYINVFNYHQNYRRSAEVLGWDLLKIAKSEIGSNRANRGNRFLTVIQYCLDMSTMLGELRRICSREARVIMVVGHKSNVLGVPFYNAGIIEHIAQETNAFVLHQRQKREFRNKFGQIIREDLLHLSPADQAFAEDKVDAIARAAAESALKRGLGKVSEKNKVALTDAIERVETVSSTPVFTMAQERQLLAMRR
jgi:16S rRNA G966 N2-methylase RsmD